MDVVRATGDRDGWTEDEVRRAQAKITSASARKQPPRWFHFLERATKWVDVAPLPSPVTGARMPLWAKNLLLARVSRVPSAAKLAWAGLWDPCDAPKSRSPTSAASPPGGLKRKRELGEGAGTVPGTSAPPIPAGLFGPGVPPGGPLPDGVHDDPLEVKVESPSYNPVPGEHSVASDYSGGEDEGGTYLCPAWAIKHRLPHLIYTSAYQGDDCTGGLRTGPVPARGKESRCALSSGRLTRPLTLRRTTMGVVLPPRRRTLRALVPALGGEPTLSASVHVGTGRGRGASTPHPPSERRRRPPPGSPMGPRGTARYGLRALRIGEASHSGPPDTDFGDRGRVRHAATVAAKVARIDEVVAAMCTDYQTLQAEKYGLVGAHTPGDPTRVPPTDPPRSVRRSGTPSSAFSNSDGAPPTSDGGGTIHRTSQTTTSSFFAKIRGDAGAGTGEGHDTPPPAHGSSDEEPWSLSPGSPNGGAQADEDSDGPAAAGSPEDPDRWLGPDTSSGRICGCRPGAPFTPPYAYCPYCEGPGEVPDSPPSPYDPSPPPAGWGGSYYGPPGRPEGWDGTLSHSLLEVDRDGCTCEVLCLCAIKTRMDGRLSLAGPGDTPGGDSATTQEAPPRPGEYPQASPPASVPRP